MTDLDELFRGLIDESAARREPVEKIETRAREHRRREHRRHRAQGFVASAVVVALVIGAVAFVRGGDEASAPPAQSSPTTTTPTVAVPAGWHTYDYGLARLSIPPGWTASTGCPSAHIFVMDDPSHDTVQNCPPPSDGPSMRIELFAGRSTRPSAVRVNGIRYDVSIGRCLVASVCPLLVRVETLHVQIAFVGDVDWHAVLRTLTHSTYARILQQPFGPTSSSWKTISFDGYSVRVPRDWKTYANAAPCRPRPNAAYYSNVRSSAGGCDFVSAATPPEDSLQLFGGSALPAATIGSRYGLTFGRLTASGPFVHTLDFVVTGGVRPLIVTVGLGLDPAIARGILGSIRPAK
jgi:hypothetical protein